MNEETLFTEAIAIESPEERSRFLDTACAGNGELRQAVEKLLRLANDASSFLERSPVEAVVAELNVSESAASATIAYEKGSTHDDDHDATTLYSRGAAPMAKHDDDSDDETPLGYLEPSTKPGSLGRLAHYEVLEVVGRGAFGTVLRAFDEKLHRVVAIKVMSPEMASTSPARKRFIREAQSSAAIRHEHVVSIHAVEEKPIPYLVMEFIPGLTLQQRLDQSGPLDVPTVLRIGRQIAEGLAAAHAQDLIHRDIKPANILLESGAREMVKVTDFGLARAADDASLTQSGTIAGTPMYMAPEQAMGNKLDQRADLFSFGSVLYQMVSGRPPFRAATTLAVLKRLAEDTPRPIREIIPEVPQWLCDIITKLHAKNPDERYQSAREIADVLANCEAQLKAHSGLKDFSLIPRAKAQPWYQNWKVKIGGGAAVVLLLLAAIFLFQTPNGTLRVEILDPEVEMKVKGTELTFHGTNLDPVSLKAGEKKLLITRGDLEFETDSFALKKGTETRVKVELLGDNLVVSGGGKVIAERPITRKEIASSITSTDTVASTLQASNTAAPPPAIAPFDAKQARTHQEAWAKHLGVPVEYTNSIGMKFVLIPPGEFTMGNTQEEIAAGLKNVAPNDKVILTQPIYLGVNEVTQAEYEKVMGVNPSHFAPLGIGKEAVAGLETAEHPVEEVSWNDAAEFCAKLSKQEKLKPFYFRAGETIEPLDGTGYRLPSEAEWEFACRAGTATKYWIGDTDEDLERAGWFIGNSGGRTHAAGELKANSFGLADIHGNVWEWVQDGWDATFDGQFQDKPAINPNTPFHACSQRVLRGGHWGDTAANCRSSNRLANVPTNRNLNLGFRVSSPVDAVKSLPQTTPATAFKQEPLPTTHKYSLGMEFVIVPQGKSWLGGGKDKLGDKEVEIPADFYLGKYEVTQEEWTQVLGENPSHFSRTGDGKDAVADISDADLKRFPVENVSWDQSQLFVEKLNALTKETGWVYRLPKQTEWEYACRGGPMADKADSAFDFYFAKPTNNPLREQTLVGKNKGPSRTIKVGSTEANRLGLFDMHRNVWEWCDDMNEAAKESGHRVHVGGGWNNIRSHSAAGNSESNLPSHRSNNLGLRLVRVPADAASSAAKLPLPVADGQ